MKIGLDLRFIVDDIYSVFVTELVKGMIEKDTKNDYIIYANNFIKGFEFENVNLKTLGIKNGSLKEQTTYLKILKKDNLNLMIFFNHYKPTLYSGNYFTLLPSLKDVYYSDFNNFFEKYTFLYILEKNLKNAKKIICFDKNTSNELTEKFNIEENKINILEGFFPNTHDNDFVEDIKINVKTKYGIKNNFFIYSAGEGVEKNYEKLVYVFDRLKKDGKDIDLVFLGEAISRNVSLRNLILNLGIQNNIHFVGAIKHYERILFYKESLGVIFPSLYEPFPFRLSEPLNFSSPILSSDLKNIKNIFGNNINYFSAISVNNIYEKLKKYIDVISIDNVENDKNIEKNEGIIIKYNKYDKIKEKYSKENTVNQMLKIIK